MERCKNDYDHYVLFIDGQPTEEDPDVPMDIDDDSVPLLTEDWGQNELAYGAEIRAACVPIHNEIRSRCEAI